MNKYHNSHVVEDGITFDSKAEARRYQELKLMLAAGEITDLEVHPYYEAKTGTSGGLDRRREIGLENDGKVSGERVGAGGERGLCGQFTVGGSVSGGVFTEQAGILLLD